MTWNDTYKRGAKVSRTYENEYISITVTNCQHRNDGQWYMNCPELNIDTRLMNIPNECTPEQAQALAVDIVKVRLQTMAKSLT
jgi:hypothetical protein